MKCDNIFQIKNILSAKDFHSIQDEFYCISNPWVFIKKERFDPEEQPYFGNIFKPLADFDTLGDNYVFIKHATNLKFKCERLIGKRLKLNRINTNIQFFGQEASFHEDGNEGSWTLNIFCRDHWQTNWGGQFVIQNKDGDYLYYPYIPNNAILFPGHLEHMGHAPNRLCSYPRLTIAFTYLELTS